MSFFGVLTLILLVLKLTGATFSWFWVVGVFLVGTVVGAIVELASW